MSEEQMHLRPTGASLDAHNRNAGLTSEDSFKSFDFKEGSSVRDTSSIRSIPNLDTTSVRSNGPVDGASAGSLGPLDTLSLRSMTAADTASLRSTGTGGAPRAPVPPLNTSALHSR